MCRLVVGAFGRLDGGGGAGPASIECQVGDDLADPLPGHPVVQGSPDVLLKLLGTDVAVGGMSHEWDAIRPRRFCRLLAFR